MVLGALEHHYGPFLEHCHPTTLPQPIYGTAPFCLPTTKWTSCVFSPVLVPAHVSSIDLTKQTLVAVHCHPTAGKKSPGLKKGESYTWDSQPMAWMGWPCLYLCIRIPSQLPVRVFTAQCPVRKFDGCFSLALAWLLARLCDKSAIFTWLNTQMSICAQGTLVFRVRKIPM